MKKVIRLIWILNLATITAGVNLVIKAPEEGEPGKTVKVVCRFEGASGRIVADLFQDGEKLDLEPSLHTPLNSTDVVIESQFLVQLPKDSKTIALQCKDTSAGIVSHNASVLVRWKVMVTIETVTSVETGSFYNVSCYMNTKDVITDAKVIVKQNNQTVDTEPQKTLLPGENITMLFLFNMTAPAEAGSIELTCLLVNRNITSNTTKVNVASTLTDKSASHEKETKTWVVAVAVVVAVVFAVLVALVIIGVTCWRKKKFCFITNGGNGGSSRKDASTDPATKRDPEEKGLLNMSTMSGPTDADADADHPVNNEILCSSEMTASNYSAAPEQETRHFTSSWWPNVSRIWSLLPSRRN